MLQMQLLVFAGVRGATCSWGRAAQSCMKRAADCACHLQWHHSSPTAGCMCLPVLLQGMQLMIVGNVGTDHPCQATCGVTAIDVAFYATEVANEISEPWLPDTGESYDMFTRDPGPIYSARINLDATDPNKNFFWNQNTTGILNFDLWDRAQSAPSPEMFYAVDRYYW